MVNLLLPTEPGPAGLVSRGPSLWIVRTEHDDAIVPAHEAHGRRKPG